MKNMKQIKIAIIGLGYVGLPISVRLSKFFKVVGYDLNYKRIRELKNGKDSTNEIDLKNFHKNKNLLFSNKISSIKDCNFYIVAVPTPINIKNKPDLTLLIKASAQVSKLLNKNDTIVYESTVYPGCTEEICIPILEQKSKLKINKDFFCGYSPERINPGDKKHKIYNISKLVSASNKKGLQIIKSVYKNLTTKKLIITDTIKIAEGAKIIENTQRDINIAFMNELSIIFNKMDVDFSKVLKAANSKWNFINFKPGIVGGHCIGVDPYYLAHKAKILKLDPKIILAGRSLNDQMYLYISRSFSLALKKKNINLNKAKILTVGLTFKENVPDFRNSQAIKITKKLISSGMNVKFFDPLVDIKINNKKNISSFSQLEKYSKYFDGIIILVDHLEIKNKGLEFFKKLLKSKNVFFDIKNVFNFKSDFKL